jgi:glycosyltransferase involved in cell wall biosynthesis
VGSLYPVKGHRFLMEAFAKVMHRYPELHLVIAGSGHLHDSLDELGRTLNLGSRFHLLGLRTDIGNVLAGADIFVLPSLAEGLPLAVLEAMLASRPIIASDVGDIRPVLDSGKAGVLVNPGDPDDLARAIDRLMSNPAEAKRLAEAAALRANTEYRLERMTSRYELLYHSLLDPDRAYPAAVLAESAPAT